MYIDPFVAGVLATLGIEAILTIIMAFVLYRSNK